MSSLSVELPASLRSYFDRSGVALALSDMSEDAPLRLVNPAFVKLTGYEAEEVTGRNCRFLQGEETTAASRQALHDFVHDPRHDSGRFPVMNYRKDGSTFQNFVFMTRLRDSEGAARFILASQFDMTSATQRARLRENDAELSRSLADVDAIGKEFGLAMMGSAQLISDSVALLAKLAFDERR